MGAPVSDERPAGRHRRPDPTTTADQTAPARPTVVHLLPYDLARGAQRYARALVDTLQSGPEPEASHVVMTLFAAESAVLRADVSLGVPRGPMRRLGLDPRAMLRLRRAIGRLAPIVVVAHGGEAAKYAALALPRRVPIVYLRIGTAHRSLARRPLSRLLHSHFVNRAAAIAAVSSDVAAEVRDVFGVPSDRIVVIPNARHADDFTPSDARGDSSAAGIIFVGHLDAGKRPDWFVDTVRELKARGTNLDAVMVGSGPLEESLKSAAGDAGIRMLGRRDDVADLLASSEIFVFTSLPPGEGMPGVLIEAGLAGLATVATRVPGAGDVVVDGETGLLVDVDDKTGLVAAVDRLARDQDLRRRMGRAAREHCLNGFTFEATRPMWDDVLARATGGAHETLSGSHEHGG